MFVYPLLYFFFQAEDGIRDRNVTGVQTCALPISAADVAGAEMHCLHRWITPSCRRGSRGSRRWWSSSRGARPVRSEERRVGKEWTTRQAAQHHLKDTLRWAVADRELDEY